MKKFLRNQKGFSMIELLVALLIMAVIAGIAIALFGNIVGQSRGNADSESAAQIKKQILLYINETNDTDLSGLINTDATHTTQSGNDIVDRLSGRIVITNGAITAPITLGAPGTGNINVAGITNVKEATPKTWGRTIAADNEVLGEYGPFLDASKAIRPQANGDLCWYIDLNKTTQEISVTTTSSSITNTVYIH